jgi:hypothetical protein
MLFALCGCGSGGDGTLTTQQQQQYDKAVESMKKAPGMPGAMPPGSPGPQSKDPAKQNPYGAGYPVGGS